MTCDEVMQNKIDYSLLNGVANARADENVTHESDNVIMCGMNGGIGDSTEGTPNNEGEMEEILATMKNDYIDQWSEADIEHFKTEEETKKEYIMKMLKLEQNPRIDTPEKLENV